MKDYNYYKKRLVGQAFPHAVLDVTLLDKNIKTNLERSGTKNIRVASKSIRCEAVMKRIFDFHEQFQGVMCYHGKEAIYLAKQGFTDLLMGYPIADTSLLGEIAKANKTGAEICLMIDSIDHLNLANAAGKAQGVQMPVCIDVDMSQDYPGLHFGVWRSSITSNASLEPVLQHIKTLDYIRLDGLMGYEAQVAGVGDAVKGASLKNTLIKMLKKRSVKSLRKKRSEAVALIESFGFEMRFVNGGGTGSLETTREEEVVTEVTVGSGFYNSHFFDNYTAFQLEPALFYAIPIVRKPQKDIYTCHGGGFIASGAVEPIKAPVVYLPPKGKLDKMEGAGEVQTPIRFSSLDVELQIGDPIYLRHTKAGELCERFNHLLFLMDNQIIPHPTYRGQGCSFG